MRMALTGFTQPCLFIGAPSSSTSSSLIRSSGSSSRPVRSDPASESTVKTHQFTGKAAVDSECSRLEGKVQEIVCSGRIA